MSNIFCADIGNYSTVTALLGQPPQIMRSVSADITHKSVMTLNTDTSPTVEINHKRLILGEYATKQKNSQTAVERGKHSPEIVKPFLFAGLHQDFEGIVRYLIPTRVHEVAASASLLRRHHQKSLDWLRSRNHSQRHNLQAPRHRYPVLPRAC